MTLEENLNELRERVSLLEATRAFDRNARPTHVVRSKYGIVGQLGDQADRRLRVLTEDAASSDLWSLYPEALKDLLEVLSPRVAKELLDAYIEQAELG